MKKLKVVSNFSNLLNLIIILVGIVLLNGCVSVRESLAEMFKPTTIERVHYEPVGKPEWEGQTIYIDFDAGYSSWYYDFASNLSTDIRDSLIEDIIEDQIFNVQDRVKQSAKYLYKIDVNIDNPKIGTTNSNIIKTISATFRIKIYDSKDNLITSKKREVRYDAPALTVSVNDSQQTLLNNYVYNASQEIRRSIYESLK